MFTHVPEDEALIVEGGVYKPAEVYLGPEGGLYLKTKGGFVRLKDRGATSHPKVKAIKLAREGDLFMDRWGRLCGTTAPDRTPIHLTEEPDGTLLALPAPSAALEGPKS